MGPNFMRFDLFHGADAHAEISGYQALNSLVCADSQHVRVAKFRLMMSSPLQSWWMLRAILAAHIKPVLILASNKQMRGIHARRIVATMADDKAGRNVFAVREYPRCATSFDWFVYFDQVNLAVSMFIFGRCPWPAFVWTTLINFLPKTFGKWDAATCFFRHMRNLNFTPKGAN